MPKKSNRKIKLVAIAKDEASYFQEWVHHHIYFGFDDIEIHINRTSDNSVEILESLKKSCPEVSWFFADWIDKCPQDAKKQIQFIVYNKVWDECIRKGDYSHIIFLDIDEFWIPLDFKSSIHEYMKRFDNDKVVSFEWLNDLGTLQEFSTIPKTIEGNLSPLVKTIYPLDTPIVELRHHVPLMKPEVSHVLADGQNFKPRESLIQAVHPSLQGLKEAFIYHRAHRSIKEYISLLYRGRPGETFPYKTNRYGLPVPDSYYQKFEFEDTAYSNYIQSLQVFLQNSASARAREEALRYVDERFSLSMKNLSHYVDQDYDVMVQMFRGVYHHEVASVFRNKRANLIAADPENFRLIRDLAIDASSQDLDEAIILMKEAARLNPDGPVIKRKLDEFLELKLKRQSSSS